MKKLEFSAGGPVLAIGASTGASATYVAGTTDVVTVQHAGIHTLTTIGGGAGGKRAASSCPY